MGIAAPSGDLALTWAGQGQFSPLGEVSKLPDCRLSGSDPEGGLVNLEDTILPAGTFKPWAYQSTWRVGHTADPCLIDALVLWSLQVGGADAEATGEVEKWEANH
ncbi:hypothetical protein NL676_028897 [Syzygium grande]|nr:hypothetical protein NL676_028897 [Syzygium grande]